MTVEGVYMQDVEQWRAELCEAGWTPIRHDVWKAPCGCLYRGPWRAWVTMLEMKANMILGVLPHVHSTNSGDEKHG